MAYQPVRHVRVASDDTIVVGQDGGIVQHGTGTAAGDAGVRDPQQFQFISMDGSAAQAAQQHQYHDMDPYQMPDAEFLQQQQQQHQFEKQQQFNDSAEVSLVSPLQQDQAQYFNDQQHQQQWDRKSGNVTINSSTPSSLQRSRHVVPRRRGSRFRSRARSSWMYEVISMAVATGAVASIIAVLAYYDGRPLSLWPFSITINAVIAILATVATASMGVPLSSGLGQLKWIRFRKGGGRRGNDGVPLSDMEVFDDASRGAVGALNMLLKGRGGLFGSFGAVIMIMALLLSPFAQQIATYPTRDVLSSIGATNFRAVSYGLALKGKEKLAAFVPILPLKSAVYYGLFAENGKPSMNLPVKCQTGNCTWDPFETLAVCHSCVDMSEYITRYCSDDTNNDDKSGCGWQLPSGAKLETNATVFSMTPLFPNGLGDMSYSTIMKLFFMGTEDSSGEPGVLRPWAQQCTLSACVQTLQSSVVNGELNETIVGHITNDTVPVSASMEGLEPVIITGANASTTSGSSSESPDSYSMSMEVILAMQGWFATLFRNASASRNVEHINRTVTTLNNTGPGFSNPVVVNLTVGISSGETFFDTDIVQAFYWNYYEYPGGIEMLVHDLAISTTVSLRSFGEGVQQINGTAMSRESFVQVRWGFVAVPTLAVLLTGAFLAIVAWETRKVMRTNDGGKTNDTPDLWKTSALAVLFYGRLDEDARRKHFDGLEGLEAKRREAKAVKVRLVDDDGAEFGNSGGNGGMLRVERVD